MSENKPYRYRIKYDPLNEATYPYWVEYNGGWRTFWLWNHLSSSSSVTFEQAKREMERHKERAAKAPNGAQTVYSE